MFPVTLESGMYLEFNSATDCKLYDSKGGFIKEVKPVGAIPSLAAGENTVAFSCEGRQDINPRVSVTVINNGAPLPQERNQK